VTTRNKTYCIIFSLICKLTIQYFLWQQVKAEAANADVSSWWWARKSPKHVERHKTSSNKLVKLLYLVG